MLDKMMLNFIKNKKPLVIESYRRIVLNNIIYKRRLRISGFIACLLDENLKTNIYKQDTEFVVLDKEDIKKACNLLQIKYKNVNTYFKVDLKMCSFKVIK